MLNNILDLERQEPRSCTTGRAAEDDCTTEFPDEDVNSGILLGLLRGGLIAPAKTTHNSIAFLLNADTKRERDELTKQWRDHKLHELNFIGVVGALLAGCLTSTGSWPSILPNGERSPWTVKVCWYTGIVFALFAVLTAAQQSIRLHRLSAHKDGLAHIRRFMGTRYTNSDGQVEIKPRRFQVYGWQASIMFLTLSVIAMVLGMCITVWASTTYGPLKANTSWWDNNAKLAVTWSTVALLTGIAFIAAQISLAIR